MKKILLLALTAIMMVGCDFNSQRMWNTKVDGDAYGVILVDSCEYIKGVYRLAHKGNCQFCAKRDSIKWEKRMQEIVKVLKED